MGNTHPYSDICAGKHDTRGNTYHYDSAAFSTRPLASKQKTSAHETKLKYCGSLYMQELHALCRRNCPLPSYALCDWRVLLQTKRMCLASYYKKL